MENRLEKIINFIQEIEKFKIILRQIWCSDLKRQESDAEHSWHLAMLVILFYKELPKNIDFNKLLKLALIHDLPEIYATDTFAFDKNKQKTKKIREQKAAKKLFAQLPPDLKKEFTDLFNEYENLASKEAKIIKALDKIQALFSSINSQGKPWRKHGVTLKEVEAYYAPFVKNDKFILNLYENLLNKAIKKKLLTN